MSEATLAARQAALVGALVAGQPVPDGMDVTRVAATERALRDKRAGEVALAWPRLAAAFGRNWPDRFSDWAKGRPPRGSLRDGWDLARELSDLGPLPPGAHTELAAREVITRYRGHREPRPRRWPAARRVPGGLVIGFRGQVRLLGHRTPCRPPPPTAEPLGRMSPAGSPTEDPLADLRHHARDTSRPLDTYKST